MKVEELITNYWTAHRKAAENRRNARKALWRGKLQQALVLYNIAIFWQGKQREATKLLEMVGK